MGKKEVVLETSEDVDFVENNKIAPVESKKENAVQSIELQPEKNEIQDLGLRNEDEEESIEIEIDMDEYFDSYGSRERSPESMKQSQNPLAAPKIEDLNKSISRPEVLDVEAEKENPQLAEEEEEDIEIELDLGEG